MSSVPEAPLRGSFRQNYAEWKSWTPRPPSDDEADAFAGELQRASIQPGQKVLELGFGAGTFLQWAKGVGIEAVGLEVVPELVGWAREAGFQAHLADDENPLGPCETGTYDAVVAFDVLEHLNHQQLDRLATGLTRCLKPGGKLFARFPNGSSPFGRHYQNGDLTHELALNETSIRQLFEPHGFKLEWARDVYVAPGRSVPKKIVRGLRLGAQLCINASLSQIYWGMQVPLAPNLSVLLKYSSGQ